MPLESAAATCLGCGDAEPLDFRFQACRVKAIKCAAQLGITERLSINFLPNAIYKPEVCIRTTIEAARTTGFPIARIVFEATEGDAVADGKWLAEILREYKRTGFLTANDDFGAGYAGLNLLADFQPDIVKLDWHSAWPARERPRRSGEERGRARSAGRGPLRRERAG